MPGGGIGGIDGTVPGGAGVCGCAAEKSDRGLLGESVYGSLRNCENTSVGIPCEGEGIPCGGEPS